VPTQSERKALLFFASVALLGAGWRTVRATAAPEPRAEDRAALEAQIAAVDSVRAGRHRGGRGSSLSGTAATVVDVDQATAAQLEGLPRIGPGLAKRIVDDRTANGPFGSLEALQRVKGIGPAMAATLAPRVTFSTSRRPTDAATYRPLTLPPLWPAAPPSKHRP
jgi:competence protein ComEA